MDMDLLQGVQERMDKGEVSDGPLPDLGNFEMPSIQSIIEALDHMDMDEEEKQKLKDTLLNEGKILETLGKGAQEDPGSLQLMIFIVAVLFITTVFVFFGYKLYKSLTEKERKREEKKKQKQQKKKK